MNDFEIPDFRIPIPTPTPTPTPTQTGFAFEVTPPTIAAIITVSAFVIGLGLLVYLKKRKH